MKYYIDEWFFVVSVDLSNRKTTLWRSEMFDEAYVLFYFFRFLFKEKVFSDFDNMTCLI